MTLSYSGRSGTGSVDGSGSAVTAAYSAANVGGHLLIAHVGWVDAAGTTNVTSLTDTNLNNWFPARAKTRQATNQYAVQIWYSFGNKAGANTVQANFSAATTFTRIGVAEYESSNGSFWTDPLDQSNGGTGSSNAPAAGNVTPTQNNELVVSTAAINSGTLSAGASYALRTTPTIDVRMEEQFQTTATLTTGAFSNTTSDVWACQAASFKDVVAPSQYRPLPPPHVIYRLILAVASRDAGPVGVVSQDADATLNVAAGLTADAVTTKPVDSSLTITATITAAGTSTKPVDAALTATATITATATVVKPVDASLTGTATIAAAASATKPVDGSLTVTAAVTPTGTSTKPVDAALTGTATITPTGTSTKPVDASLSNTATISAAASAVKPVDAAVSTTATITAAGTSTKPVDAALTATATITADATVGALPKTFDSSLTVTATITAAATVTKPVTAALTATATITPTGSIPGGGVTFRPNTGTTTRPSTGTTSRPGSGTTSRPSSGITVRPFTGVTPQP